MEANFLNGQISKIVNKIIDRVMLTTGVFALVWILAFLLVGIIDK
jgi:hypothetical protein